MDRPNLERRQLAAIYPQDEIVGRGVALINHLGRSGDRNRRGSNQGRGFTFGERRVEGVLVGAADIEVAVKLAASGALGLDGCFPVRRY